MTTTKAQAELPKLLEPPCVRVEYSTPLSAALRARLLCASIETLLFMRLQIPMPYAALREHVRGRFVPYLRTVRVQSPGDVCTGLRGRGEVEKARRRI